MKHEKFEMFQLGNRAGPAEMPPTQFSGGRPMKKRLPVTSSKVRVQIAQAAVKKIEPPAHVPLSERDFPFWQSIVEEFPAFEWTPHQLEMAAILARMLSDMENDQACYRAEGSILPNGQINPRQKVISALSSSILALRRALSLHAGMKDPRVVGKRRRLGKEIERDILDAAGDDFIATPDS